MTHHDINVPRFIPFDELHARNIANASGIKGRLVLQVGDGATGSTDAEPIALTGADLTIIDRDIHELPNVPRSKIPLKYIGWSKAIAHATHLREGVSSEQRIRGIHADVNLLSNDELLKIMRPASVVVGATGSDAIDRRLNRLCARLGIPLVVPRLWPVGEASIGHIFVVRWPERPRVRGRFVRRMHAPCFECWRPAEGNRPDDLLEAQPGMPVDVGHVALTTAQIVLALLLPDSDEGQRLREGLRINRNLFLVQRMPMRVESVDTSARKRDACPACSTTNPDLLPAPFTLRSTPTVARRATTRVSAASRPAIAPRQPATRPRTPPIPAPLARTHNVNVVRPSRPSGREPSIPLIATCLFLILAVFLAFGVYKKVEGVRARTLAHTVTQSTPPPTPKAPNQSARKPSPKPRPTPTWHPLKLPRGCRRVVILFSDHSGYGFSFEARYYTSGAWRFDPDKRVRRGYFWGCDWSG